MPDEQRDLELMMLGAILASTTVAKSAFATLEPGDFSQRDIGSAFAELKESGLGNWTKGWLKRHGVTVNGKAIEGVLADVKDRAQKRRLRYAIAGGDVELAMKLLEQLRKP